MGKELRADIVIGGKAHNSFYKLGNELERLGSQINVLSEPLIEFGKESTKTYASYEDAMLDAQVAMRTQYESTTELGKAMETLDAAAQKWASDSRFNTQDVAGAISEAAHAGWDLEKVLNGVPAAMKISLAGGMSLAEGLEYLVDISNAAGLGFEDLNGLVDTWAFAANKSSTTIPEMGQAMQKMGATMQFVKGDMAGLTTMLAVLANNGAKGTEAGTLLRNSMIRLIAPTKTAAEAMDLLGISDEELDSLYSGASNLEEVNAMLQEAGFSAYDAQGDLKSFLDIFQELDKATSGMTEQDRNKVLSAIFPTRTITGALALLDAAKSGWDGLYASIQTGSEGYAEYAADTMESGLGGSLRHLESVYNALQTKVGDNLSEEVSSVADSLSGWLENINQMDDGKFNAIISGLEVIAGAGPALMVGGGAVKLISSLFMSGPVGKIALAGTALAALGAYLNGIADANYEDSFGDLSLDAEKLGTYLDSLGSSFQKTQEQIEKHREQVNQAVEQYTEAGASLKESLLTSMVTDKNLTQAEKDGMHKLGDQMVKELEKGATESYKAGETFVESLNNLSSDADDKLIDGLKETLRSGYEGAIEEAKDLSIRLKAAMNSAFADGIIDSSEVNNIQEVMDKMNETMAKQAEKAAWKEKRSIFLDAQTMGLEGLDELTSRLEKNREDAWKPRESYYGDLLFDVEEAYKNGSISETAYREQTAGLEKKRLDELNAHYAKYDKDFLQLYDTTISGSDYGGNYKDLKGIAERYLAGEKISLSEFGTIYDSYTNTDRKGLAQALDGVVEALGGKESAIERIDYYEKNGLSENAAALRTLMLIEEFSNFTNGLPGNDSQYLNYESKDIEQKVDIKPKEEGWGLEELEAQGVTVDIYGDATRLTATIDGEDGKTLVEYLDGDATDIDAVIMDKNGTIIETIIDGNPKQLESAISKYDGKTVTVSVNYKTNGLGTTSGGTPTGGRLPGGAAPLFAEGGRATEASIFGEAGPEWAIPEEHTQRTAELLSAAARASGFTWPELLSRNGGLNAGSRGSYTLVYSPIIHAADATGVEQKLKDDKNRLEKWLRDKQLHDDLEVYQ